MLLDESPQIQDHITERRLFEESGVVIVITFQVCYSLEQFLSRIVQQIQLIFQRVDMEALFSEGECISAVRRLTARAIPVIRVARGAAIFLRPRLKLTFLAVEASRFSSTAREGHNFARPQGDSPVSRSGPFLRSEERRVGN